MQLVLVVATALIFLVRLTFSLYQSRVDARIADARRRQPATAGAVTKETVGQVKLLHTNTNFARSFCIDRACRWATASHGPPTMPPPTPWPCRRPEAR
jgi:hypothetical protein